MDKAPDAFRTISEVAEDLDIPQHVLRFWESRFAQIKPMKRAGGRRYYRPDDVDLLRGIRHLLYGEGYTIRGVQRILKEHGGKFVQSVWQAGAEQPQPMAGDLAPEEAAIAAQETVGAVRHEPLLFRPGESVGSVSPRGEAPPDAATDAPTAGSGFTPEKLHRLQAVLDDLLECRRLLDAGLNGPA